MSAIIRGLAAVVVFAGAALGAAGPARAIQAMEGVYNYTEEGSPPATWTIVPTCVPICDRGSPECTRPVGELPAGCTLHVTSSVVTVGNSIYGNDARVTNGLWTFTTTASDGLKCPDGSTAPLTKVYSFSDETLTGTLTISYNADCGMQPGLIKKPFTLAYVGPVPMPIVRYPLICHDFNICS